MLRLLEFTLLRTRHNTPLVSLDSPLGNGQEIEPAQLRSLATELQKIADLADAMTVGRVYREYKKTTQY